MEVLRSLKNPKVQLWRALKDRKARKASGLFLAEGRKMCEEALASSFPIEAVLIREGTSFDAGEHPCYVLSETVFDALCDTKTPQGVIAVVGYQSRKPSGHRLIALDGVQDPGNVGTIMRTADAAGFDGVLLSEACADPFSPKALRATMGSVFRMPVQVVGALADSLRSYRDRGYAVLCSQLDGEPFYQRRAVGEQFIIVIGSEGNGVTHEVAEVSTHHLRLPMRGGAESLNAAVAAGIMMYDLTREMGKDGSR